MATEQKLFKRFTWIQRMEHMLMLLTFTGLAVTGLPQRYSDTALGADIINLLGGIESIRIAHRVFAVGLLIGAIYHGGHLTYRIFVLRRPQGMRPGLRDLRDLRDWTLFNLGLRRQHPHMPRYNFIEKVEYLAVVWGTVVMAITGFMLWNPVAAARWFPGSFIPAALTAHSAEALLAVLSILIWHMYHVHIRRFNRSIFTGAMSRELMAEEHAEELEKIESGHEPVPPSPEQLRRRHRIYVPYATVMTIVLVGLLFRFVTAETTAITTELPVVNEEDINAPLLVDADAGDIDAGAALWQTLRCQECHGADALGGSGPLNIALANTQLSIEDFARTVRRGPADMPAFPPSALSGQQIADLYVWLQSLDAGD